MVKVCESNVVALAVSGSSCSDSRSTTNSMTMATVIATTRATHPASLQGNQVEWAKLTTSSDETAATLLTRLEPISGAIFAWRTPILDVSTMGA